MTCPLITDSSDADLLASTARVDLEKSVIKGYETPDAPGYNRLSTALSRGFRRSQLDFHVKVEVGKEGSGFQGLVHGVVGASYP